MGVNGWPDDPAIPLDPPEAEPLPSPEPGEPQAPEEPDGNDWDLI